MSSSSLSSASSVSIEEAQLYAQIMDVIRRSMCHDHFAGFAALHECVEDVCMMIAGTSDEIKNPIKGFFPSYPAKVTHDLWVQFDHWLEAEDGEPIKPECKQWCEYGCWTIESCQVCLFESEHPGEGVVDLVTETEEEYEQNAESDEE